MSIGRSLTFWTWEGKSCGICTSVTCFPCSLGIHVCRDYDDDDDDHHHHHHEEVKEEDDDDINTLTFWQIFILNLLDIADYSEPDWQPMLSLAEDSRTTYF